jgi:hypothetical protein
MKPERMIAFPFARRRGVILRLARQMVARGSTDAEEYLQQQLRRQIVALATRAVVAS